MSIDLEKTIVTKADQQRFAESLGKVKKKRLFVQNVQSGEPWYYCGTVGDHALEGAMNICRSEVEVFLSDDMPGEELTLDFKVEQMTDEEVAALPDI